jgi:hypothetical protein
MDRFDLTIELGNAAMRDAADVSIALEQIADRLEGLEGFPGFEGVIVDANGNTVGRWRFA